MKKRILVLFLIITLTLSACAKTQIPGTATQPAVTDPAAATTAPASNEAELIPVTLPVGYIPNIQFAPLYVGIEKGFYRDAGINLSVDYSMENDNAVLVANNNLQFAVVSGEQVLMARAQQMPIVYVMAWYQEYPVGVAAKTSSGIKSVSDLKGRKIGLPGTYGANYIGLIALLDSIGLSEADVVLDSIGYNQVEMLMADKDDAVVIYSANEPVQLKKLGQDIVLFKVSDSVELVGNGIITNEKTLAENPELVRAVVEATLRSLDYVMDHPEESFEISKKYVDNLADADQEVQMQVLLNSIDLWQAERMGYSNPQAWENMQNILLKMGLLTQEQDLSRAFDNQFIP
jgi:NitT/TauT family transport system substrate-binding protein